VTRLKLRDDAYYAPTDAGIYILTNHGEVVMSGPSIFQWVDRLARYLNGQHTLAELTAAMPADRKKMTERVVTALCERGVVVEVREEEAEDDKDAPRHPLTDGERRLYRREIDFLGYFGPSAERSFQAYRDKVVLLVGAGPLLVEIFEAALLSGSRRLRVAVAGQGPDEIILLAECERRAKQRDQRQRVSYEAADPADGEQLSHIVAGADIVVYACDHAVFDQAHALDRACAQAGVPFVAAIMVGDHAWLGPFGPETDPWPGWTSAWRRLLAQGDLARGQDDPAAPPGGNVWPRAALTVVANQLVREVVRRLSGTVEPSGHPRMAQADLPSLRTASHRFLPHPFSLPASRRDETDLLATVARLREGGPLDAEEFSQRVAACLERRLGVLGEVTERDFAQIPLAVSQVEVSDPVLLLDPGMPLPAVIGTGLSVAEARHAAVLRGLATYGSLMVDPRRLHVDAVAAGLTGDPDEDLAALLAGSWNGFVWGYGLADERPHAVPAAVVFPALRGVRSSYAPPPGAGAGFDWQEAVRTGLLGQCRRLTLRELVNGRRPFGPIEWNEVALDARGSRCRSIVKIVGGKLDVYDVTGSPRVPTLAFRLDGVTAAYASGFSFSEALRDGLAQVLLSHQTGTNHDPYPADTIRGPHHSETNHDPLTEANRHSRPAEADRDLPGYAPAHVPPLPVSGRERDPSACPTWSTDPAAVASRLARLGWTAVAVPLDHDPGVADSIMPYLVNVVVTRG
jgi:hypothetical protein